VPCKAPGKDLCFRIRALAHTTHTPAHAWPQRVQTQNPNTREHTHKTHTHVYTHHCVRCVSACKVLFLAPEQSRGATSTAPRVLPLQILLRWQSSLLCTTRQAAIPQQLANLFCKVGSQLAAYHRAVLALRSQRCSADERTHACVHVPPRLL